MDRPLFVRLRTLWSSAVAHRVTGLAAEVAFWATIGAVPAVLVVATFLGLAGGVGERAADRLVEAARTVTADRSPGLVDALGSLLDQPRPGIFSLALVTALWAASRGLAATAAALEVIAGVADRRPWLVRRSVGLGLGVGSLVAVSLLAVGVVAAGSADRFLPVGGAAAFAVVLVVAVGWVTVVLRFGPGDRRPWRQVVPGAVAAVAVGVVFTAGFRVYLELEGANPIVVGLGGVLVGLLWLYLLALGVLLGAEMNEAIGRGWEPPAAPYDERHDRH